MDCAKFEQELVALAERGPTSSLPPRDPRVSLLKAHTETCPDCAASADLVELLALPPERDPVPDPGTDYWASFNERVRQRIDHEALPARRPTRRWPGVAAATILVAVAASWILRERSTDEGAEMARTQPVETRTESAAEGLPEELVSSVELASAGEIDAELQGLEAWGSWGGGFDGGADEGLFPDVADLGSEARQELLQWLREQV